MGGLVGRVICRKALEVIGRARLDIAILHWHRGWWPLDLGHVYAIL